MNVEAYPDAIVSEIFIAAQPEQVFRALTDPEQVPRWWGQDGVYRCTRFDSDLRVGGKWSSSGVGPDGGSFKIAGEYLQVDPPRLLAYTWVASWTGELQTTVCWLLAATREGTRVTIEHSGLSAHPELAESYKGWSRVLGWLQAYLEKGETVATRKAS